MANIMRPEEIFGLQLFFERDQTFSKIYENKGEINFEFSKKYLCKKVAQIIKESLDTFPLVFPKKENMEIFCIKIPVSNFSYLKFIKACRSHEKDLFQEKTGGNEKTKKQDPSIEDSKAYALFLDKLKKQTLIRPRAQEKKNEDGLNQKTLVPVDPQNTVIQKGRDVYEKQIPKSIFEKETILEHFHNQYPTDKDYASAIKSVSESKHYGVIIEFTKTLHLTRFINTLKYNKIKYVSFDSNHCKIGVINCNLDQKILRKN